MPETIRRIDYFYTCVDDKPGEGYRLLARLRRREVNFLAFSAFPSGPGQVQLNFFPEDHEALQRAAGELSVQLMGPKKAFLIQGDDKVGALADVFKSFYEADINIHAANCVCSDRGSFGLVIWVNPNDYTLAAEVLGLQAEPDVAQPPA